MACATLVVVIAGALVTSNDAGLSVPDWPTSFGFLIKMPGWAGGVRYEWTHRMLAGSLASLTMAIAFWTLIAERRGWVRKLAFAALGTIMAQAILGGMTVLFLQPPMVSAAHAMVAQTFFSIAVAIALVTGRRWVQEQPNVVFDRRHPALISLTLASIFILYAQLFLGAMFRHHGMSWWPHVLNATVVTTVLSWTAFRAIFVYRYADGIKRPAAIMLGLLIAQLGLGFAAFVTRVNWGRDPVQPETPMVVATVAHVAVGALLLATSVVLAIEVRRHMRACSERGVTAGERKAITA